MKKLVLIIVALAVAAGIVAGLRFVTAERSSDEILVLCGGSMRAVLEDIKLSYEQENPDVTVLTTYGGSGELCAQIQNSGRGDLYLCHDPFMPWAADQGLVSEWTQVAALNIVIVVPKGNPKGIKELRDLANPGLRLGVGNRTYSTSGQIVKAILNQEPYGEDILKNVRVETKGHQTRCNDVALGTLDTAIVWDAVASLYKDRLETIPIPMQGYDAITSATYQRSELTDVPVTIGLITGAEKRDAAREFYEFVLEKGPAIFDSHGFSRPRKL